MLSRTEIDVELGVRPAPVLAVIGMEVDPYVLGLSSDADFALSDA